MTLKPLFSNTFHSLCLSRSACFLWNFLFPTLSESDTFSLKLKPVFLFLCCVCIEKNYYPRFAINFLNFSPQCFILIFIRVAVKHREQVLYRLQCNSFQVPERGKSSLHKYNLGSMYKNAILLPSFSQQPFLLAVLWSTMYTDNWITEKSMKMKKSYGTKFANESSDWFGRRIWHSKVSACTDELRFMGGELF